MNTSFTLWRFLRPHRRAIVWTALCVLGTVAIQLWVPYIVGRVVDGWIAGSLTTSEIVKLVALAVGVSALGGWVSFWMRRWPLQTGYEIEHELRRDVFEHLTRLEPGFYREERTGDLMTRLTADIATVREFIGQGLLQGVRSLVVMVFAFSAMWWISPRLTAVVAALFPPLVLVFGVMLGQIRRRHERVQEQYAALTNFCEESFAGIRAVRSVACEAERERQFERLGRELIRASVRLGLVQNPLWPLFGLCFAVGTWLLLWVGAQGIADGTVSLGTIVQFQQYLLFVQWPLLAIGWIASLIQRGRASWARLEKILRRAPAIADGPHTDVTLTEVRGDIEWRDVVVEVEGRRVLDHVNLTVPEGIILGLTGPVASGKTVLVSLVPRLLDPTSGCVRIGGRNVREYPLAVLRRSMGVVLQEPVLFSDTLHANIAFGAEAAEDELVRHVVWLAHLHEEVMAMPTQYDTMVGERGWTLSGGQRRRAALARALARRPRYLILDDVFSAVDIETETTILARLRPMLKGCTVILVSHRLSTLRHADHIAVLEHGRITAIGTHDELARRPGYYADLVAWQELNEQWAASTS